MVSRLCTLRVDVLVILKTSFCVQQCESHCIAFAHKRVATISVMWLKEVKLLAASLLGGRCVRPTARMQTEHSKLPPTLFADEPQHHPLCDESYSLPDGGHAASKDGESQLEGGTQRAQLHSVENPMALPMASIIEDLEFDFCLLYTSPSPRDRG